MIDIGLICCECIISKKKKKKKKKRRLLLIIHLLDMLLLYAFSKYIKIINIFYSKWNFIAKVSKILKYY